MRQMAGLKQNQQESDKKFEKILNNKGFRFSYEGGQIPQKDGECVQTNSDMGHSKSRASLGMHDIACECSECLLEKTNQIARAKSMENFRIDASKNNRPNNEGLQQNLVGKDEGNYISVQDPQAQKQNGDFCVDASHSNRPMKNVELPQDPRAQQQNKDFCVDNSLKNVPQKIIECCDKQNARYSDKKALETSFYHSQNCSETVPKFVGRSEQLSLNAKQLLANPDNNNRPNKNCCESLHSIAQSDITSEGAVDESLTAAITRLREILHRDMSSVGQEMSQVKQKVERVVTDMRELSGVVDHDIMKRDQESERIKQKLLESEKTTDKFKQETPTLNVFAAPKGGLRTEGHEWAPDPLIQALPIQCVKVPRFKVKVEGVELECVIDSGAGPALIVPEGL
ncbi:MAG: hypothetical protein GY821_04200, partial [Gammaproteobacteria bacterium]|nr:hypothetical protein [Gammaproteobacteria bacterium]